MERYCGMTMHADRPGANNLLREAPHCLLEAFQIAKAQRDGGCLNFFRKSFDRSADPCLEGRTCRILEYLEKTRLSADPAAKGKAPWEDVSLKPMPEGALAQDVVGEHLRVFVNECAWRWASEKGIDYEEAKSTRMDDAAFEVLFNAATFEHAMLMRGVAAGELGVRWETQTDRWEPYEDDISAKIERARKLGHASCEVALGPKQWRYTIDITGMVQRNPKTMKERPIRCVALDPLLAAATGDGKRGKQMSKAELDSAIKFFVDMCTLPPAPETKGPERSRSLGAIAAEGSQNVARHMSQQNPYKTM